MRILKIYFLLPFLLTLGFGAPLQPKLELKIKYEISSLELQEDTLFVSTTQGVLLVYDIKNPQNPILKQTITLPSYKDFFDNSYKPKIYNTATNAQGEILIIAANGNSTRDIFLQKNDKLELLLEDQNIAKAAWVSPTEVIFGFLSHEIALFNVATKTLIYQNQITNSSFSDMLYNAKDRILYTTGESGAIYIIDPESGALIEKISNINKDRVFQIAFGDNKLVSAGNDRRVGVYTLESGTKLTRTDSLKTNFLVYSVGISQNGENIAYMSDEFGEITITNSHNLNAPKIILKGVNGVANSIFFYKDFVIVGCDGDTIYFFYIRG
ncbi:WD40 repeat domain-containing protein [Helicobacter himalayensis]|uniref:WD40 repeat domain-containing protein n=1 Tax=Helicobacter himalayensis TaxID=1591088 RepID=UPI00082E1736|nr:WD40 repeat domain-containing protein [Helicobacter himalayensis]